MASRRKSTARVQQYQGRAKLGTEGLFQLEASDIFMELQRSGAYAPQVLY